MAKLIGMIGGVSWESTTQYYKLINQAVRSEYGRLNSARILIHSLNYDPVVEFERLDKWDAVAEILVAAAKSVERGGADFLILGCNTLHKVSDAIEKEVKVPFIHIADGVGEAAVKMGARKVGLLATQFTMEEGFYTRRLGEKYGLEVIVPPLADRQVLDDIIYNELCVGKFLEISRVKLIDMMKALTIEGAENIILACTELGMLVKEEDSPRPVFDTVVEHVRKAVALSLGSSLLHSERF